MMEGDMADPVTGLTPAPTMTVIAPTPIAAGIHTQPSFDVIELLPPAAADKLRQLRQRASDAHRLTVPYEDIRAASDAKIAAQNALKRLTNHPHDHGFNLKAGDQRVIAAQRTLDKATDELQRLQERQQERSSGWQARASVVSAVEGWLRDGRPSGTTLDDHPTPDVKLNKGESVTDAISRLQRRTRELRADLHRIESAPQPSSWAKQAMREQVEALAARGEPDVSVLVERGANIVWPTTQVQVTIFNAEPGAIGYAEMPDMLAIAAYLHKDAMIAALACEITSEADDKAAMTHEARQKAEAEVLGDLLDIERQEASLVWQAQAQTLPAEHRHDCSPVAILGCRLITALRTTPSGTSADHGYNIVGVRR
jgi:hypothetical protein